MTEKNSYFGLTEKGIIKMRSLIHNDRLLPFSYQKELYNYIDYILANDNNSLFNILPRVGNNEPSLILSLINLYDFVYGDTLNNVVIKKCKSKPRKKCGPTFMMNLIGNIFLLIQEPNVELLKAILQKEKELNSKLIQEPPSIRSQNLEFTSIFVNNKVKYNESFLLFNDIVFKMIDNIYRNVESQYKFDGLSYTILNQENQPDLRKTMFVYLDVAFNIISYLHDFYKTEKSSITKWPQTKRKIKHTPSKLRGGKSRKMKSKNKNKSKSKNKKTRKNKK